MYRFDMAQTCKARTQIPNERDSYGVMEIDGMFYSMVAYFAFYMVDIPDFLCGICFEKYTVCCKLKFSLYTNRLRLKPAHTQIRMPIVINEVAIDGLAQDEENEEEKNGQNKAREKKQRQLSKPNELSNFYFIHTQHEVNNPYIRNIMPYCERIMSNIVWQWLSSYGLLR